MWSILNSETHGMRIVANIWLWGKTVIENGQIWVFLMTKNIHGYDVH